MSDKRTRSRRQYLKATGAVTVATTTGLAGCLGDLTGGGGAINFGSVLPITGDLSDFGPGMRNGVKMAVSDINDAGGPLGREVNHNATDSETDAQKAKNKLNSLVSEDDIVGFVGAASSGVSVPLSKSVADDQVMQVSPASTSPTLATLGYNDDESVKYFGRTAPNDGQQGIVMGKILNESSYIGADTAAFLHVDNAYGEGLAKKARDNFDGETLQLVGYSSKTSDYTSTLDKLFEGDPDAVGFVGYPESGESILNTWDEGGYGGEWVLSEGLNSSEFFSSLSDTVEGMYVSSPKPEQTDSSDTFTSNYSDEYDGDPPVFSAHSYDATFLMALAIHKAGEANGQAIANNIVSVSKNGTKVNVGEFQKAKDLLDDDESINYQGASSPVDMNDKVEPLNRFAVLQVGSGGSTETLEEIPRSFFEGKL